MGGRPQPWFQSADSGKKKCKGCVLNELALAGRTGRVNSGVSGAGPHLLFLPRSETGWGGTEGRLIRLRQWSPFGDQFIGVVLDGVGRHHIPFQCSPPLAGEMKRGPTVRLKHPEVGEDSVATLQPKKDAPKLVPAGGERDGEIWIVIRCQNILCCAGPDACRGGVFRHQGRNK